MWHMLFSVLRRQPGNTLLAGGGFFFAACTLILLTSTTQSTAIQANYIISQNWRPAYDMVVLPPKEQVPPGKAVPADAIDSYEGGISVQQYRQIQHLPGVEVAAPIAYAGYVRIPSVALAFAPDPLPSGYYRVDWTFSESNGKQTSVTRQESEIYYVPTCDEYESASFRQDLGSLSQAMQQQHLSMASGCGVNSGTIPTPFIGPDTGPFLLAAVDPAEENQLLHLDRHITTGRMLTNDDTLQLSPGSTPPRYQVPIVVRQQLPGKATMHATLSRVTTQHMSLREVIQKGGFTYLAHLPDQQVLFSRDVPTVQDLLPTVFKAGHVPALYWDGQGWQPVNELGSPIDLNFLGHPSGLTYQPASSPTGATPAAYALHPAQEQQGPQAAFRTLAPITTRDKSASYDYQFVGQYDSSTLSAQFSNPLNWLPETTYTSSPVQLRYDAQGHPLTPTPLLPTTDPHGFLLQPPVALTTLSAAQSILGDTIISTIRVRVAGVSTANQASWNRVALVAEQIQRTTGLRVVVTLGSSPQPTLVYVPGVQAGQGGATHAIAPLGWVQDAWIYIGAAVLYLSQLGATRLLFLGAILLVSLGYLVVTFSALASTQRKTFAVLSALGWRPWMPVGVFLGQATLLALGGGIAGIAAALLLAVLFGVTPYLLVIVWTLPAILCLGVLSVAYPLWQIWRIRPAEALRAGITLPGGAWRSRRLRLPAPPLFALSLGNLARQRVRTLIALGSIFFSALLLAIMVSGLLAFRQALQGTLLGNAVLFQTQIPQIAGAVFAVLLTFFSIADLLLLQVRQRQQEIGLLRAVGWRANHIRRLFVQEGLVLAIGGGVPGVLVALWVLTEQHVAQGTVPFPLIAGGALLLMLLVGGLATLPALRETERLQVREVLRAE